MNATEKAQRLDTMRKARGPREHVVAALNCFPAITMAIVAAAGMLAGAVITSVTAAETVEVVLAEDPRDINGVAHARVQTPDGSVETIRLTGSGATEKGDTVERTLQGGQISGAPFSPAMGGVLGLTLATLAFLLASLVMTTGRPQRWVSSRLEQRGCSTRPASWHPDHF